MVKAVYPRDTEHYIPHTVYRDIKLRRFWSHDLDPLVSRDVIDHVFIGLAICGFP